MRQPSIRATIALALLTASPALAQMRGGSLGGAGAAAGTGFVHGSVADRATRGVAPQTDGVRITFGGGLHRHRRFPRFGREGFLFGDGLFWGDEPIVEEERTATEKDQPVVPAIHIAEPTKPPEPLLIELQGDHFVRLTDAQVNAEQVSLPRLSRTEPVHKVPQDQNNVRHAVLVFRDGHQQEVSRYAIIGPALYESAGYWSAGYWTKKILLADLDLPATISANQQRGVNFVLPSAPNQVLVF